MAVLPETYRIYLDDMRFHAPVGVSADERKVGNDIVVAIAAECMVSENAFRDDELDGTPDYSVVYRDVSAIVKQPVMLLEHLAYKVACTVLDASTAIVQTEVRITKVNPPVGADGLKASVVLNVSREECR